MKHLSAEEARVVATKLLARARYSGGIEVREVTSSVEVAGIVDVVELVAVTVRWRCPSCQSLWEKKSRPKYAELRDCRQCGAKFFLRRPGAHS